MIISASRRTDIPAFYSEWFLNRIKEKYVLVPNPYNPNMISRVNLDPAVIDCIVFWTKNPAPMIDKLDRLQDYKYYFQFTLNPYGTELESKLPPLQKRIDTFKRLSDKIGREKVVILFLRMNNTQLLSTKTNLQKWHLLCMTILKSVCWALLIIIRMCVPFSVNFISSR